MESLRIRLDEKTKAAIRRKRKEDPGWNASAFCRKQIQRAAAQIKESSK